MQNLPRSPGPGTWNLELRAAFENRREQIIFAGLRNLIPLLGILFLGWSAQDLIVLYFADTLGAMWALITALALNFPEAKLARGLLARLQMFATMVFVGAFLVAFMAIPLGMPLFIYMAIVDWDWQAALQDRDFLYGIVLIGVLSFVSLLRQYQGIADKSPDDAGVKRDFGILMTRWMIVLMLTYAVGFLLGEWGAYLMVLGYLGGTMASELFPERFANLLGKADPRPHKKKRSSK